MKALKLFAVIAVASLTVACGNNSNQTADQVATKAERCCDSCKQGGIEGKWIQPIEGQEGKFEGFELKADGIAESVNMATLKFEKWSKDSTTLTLSGKSIGNGQTIDFSDVYTIAQSDNNTLTLLKDGSVVWSLTRDGAKECCKDGTCTDSKEEGCKEATKADDSKKGCTGCGGCEE
ncbi:MAG: lipocalin family protein [Bacteroidales bacterium]